MQTNFCNVSTLLKWWHCISLVFYSTLMISQEISPVWIIDNHHFEFDRELSLVDVFTPSPGRICTNPTLSLADREGNLLIYTDGRNLYDQSHNITPNGRDLVSREFASSNLFIIQDYLNSGEHYIFSTDFFGTLLYSVVDMSLNDGMGDIAPGRKNISFLPNTLFSYINVMINNCDDYWIVAKEQQSKNIHFIQINQDQTITSSFVSSDLVATSDQLLFAGGLIISNNNRSIVVDNGSGNKALLTFDDNLELTNELLLESLTDPELSFRGVFSPSGNYYYGTEQFIVRDPELRNTTVIVRHGPFLNTDRPEDAEPIILNSIQSTLPNDLAIGPDENIYFMNYTLDGSIFDDVFLGIIRNTDTTSPLVEPFELLFNDAGTSSCLGGSLSVAQNVFTLRQPNLQSSITDSTDCMIHTIQTSLSDGDDHMSSFAWSTGDTTASIVVEQPGEFTVEVDSEGCVLRDTIEVTIDEGCELPVDVPVDTSITTPVDTSVNIPMSNCNIYIPNAISLGSTRGNNSFVPVSNCAFDEYTLQVFDRYGGRIFSSVDPNLSWDGSGSEQSILNGIYTYTVRYRFLGSSDLIYDSGTLTVIN